MAALLTRGIAGHIKTESHTQEQRDRIDSGG